MNRDEPAGHQHTTTSESVQLRRSARRRRESMGESGRHTAAKAVAAQVIDWLESHPVRTLGAYVATRGEVDPAAIVAWAHSHGIEVSLPVAPPGEPAALSFRRHGPDDELVIGRFALLEPAPAAPLVDPSFLDVVLVPVVLVDVSGHRMGSGFGYYDRTFAFVNATSTTRTVLIGLAYEWQLMPVLPSNVWDVDLDVIVTESGLFSTGVRGVT